MNRKTVALLLGCFLLCVASVSAQGRRAICINEVMVQNDSNYMDDYGLRHGWIELFNSSFAPIEISSMYLTNDKNNPKKYPVPRMDVNTEIPARQHIVFWADNEPNKGTFHINFVLDPFKENYVALYDADGRTLIDEITIPAGQLADISYGRVIDGEDEWAQLTKVTPSTNNLTLDSNEKIDNFRQNDSWGIGMTITAMAVVFLGLFLLYVIFKQIGNLSIAASKRNALKSANATGNTVSSGEISGEALAAIATALYEMSDDNHDIEHTVLTIRKVQRAYSPWSSKIYGLRQTPQK